MVTRITIAALVALTMTAPAGAHAEVVNERGAVSAAGRWHPSEPSIPERAVHVHLKATNATSWFPSPILPCPPPTGCAAGALTIVDSQRHPVRGSVDCLSVPTPNEAFLGITLLHGDLLIPAAAYARDAMYDAGPLAQDSFALVEDISFDCTDPTVREHLREIATPIQPGDVSVTDLCDLPGVFCVQGPR